MKTLRRLIFALVLIALLVLAVAPAAATRYIYHDLGNLGGTTYAFSADINNSGQVVGGATNSSGNIHAFSLQWPKPPGTM